MSTDLEKLAIETAHGIDRDTNTCGFNHNVNLIKSALERATEIMRAELDGANELLAAYRYSIGFYPDDGGYRALKLLNGTTSGKEMLDELRAQLAAASEDSRRLEHDRERLLNVLEHCALPDGTRPEKQHEVAATVVKEYRPAMAQQKGG